MIKMIKISSNSKDPSLAFSSNIKDSNKLLLFLNKSLYFLSSIQESEEKVYGPNSLHVGKTLKMLGLVFMNTS